MKLINNEKQFTHIVKIDSKLYDYLKNNLFLSFRQTNTYIKNNNIFVNDFVIKGNCSLNEGDIITIYFNDETNDYEKEEINLNIIYETNDLLIINKEPKILVHPTKNIVTHTYANAISYYFDSIKLKRKIRFVNRLDMDTSGLLIIAKNSYSHGFLAKQFETNQVIKTYLAIVSGHFIKKQGVIKTNIKKDSIKYKNDSLGKFSETHYKVLKEYEKYSLVEVELKSGRTHQIRVHLASLGHFIIGDILYYKPSEIINRQALHAFKLRFIEPRTFKPIILTCQLPQDMKQLLT